MAFNKKTIKDIDVEGKRVLLRADYNVPITDDGQIGSDFRIKRSLETVQYLLDHNAKLIICSHLGRPKSADDETCTLKPVAERLGQLLNREVQFSDDCVGEAVQAKVNELQPGQVLLLENLRYHKEEEANDDGFATQLASLAEVFVQDGFGVVHRAHASTEAVTHHLPSVAGLLLAKEVDTITSVMESPKRPLLAIIGGAKIADKLDVLNRFIDIADGVVVGGAMANTFLLSENIKIGKSLADADDVSLARDITEKAKAKAAKQPFVFFLPQDGVVANKIDPQSKTRIVNWDSNVISAIENYPGKPGREATEINEDEMILDIGPFSGAFIAGVIQGVSTVVWNGTMGVAEASGVQGPVGPFAHGTEIIMDAMLGEFGHKPFTVVGGGDTASYLENRELTEHFDHVSTGGGASMELMSGKQLPGVEALENK